MLTPGNLFIERDAARPKCFHVQDDPDRTGWLAVKHNLDPQQLDSELAKLGWTFFFMANVIRKSALNFDPEKGTSVALRRVLASVRAEGCNCLQIEAVKRRSFCGIPYLSVFGHPRHLQKGIGVAFLRHPQSRPPELAPGDLRPKRLIT
jgi:hypothetical protein